MNSAVADLTRSAAPPLGRPLKVCLASMAPFVGGAEVAADLVKAAKEDGLTIQMRYDAVGQLKSCMEILKELKGEGMAKLASTPRLPEDLTQVDGAKVNLFGSLRVIGRGWSSPTLSLGLLEGEVRDGRVCAEPEDSGD